MQRLSREGIYLIAHIFRQPVHFCLEGSAIIRITNDRMANMRHVNTDLVRTARLESAFHQRGDLLIGPAVAFENGIVRDRVAGIRPPIRHDGAQCSVLPGSPKRRFNLACNSAWHAPDEGYVGTLQFAVTTVVGKRLCKGTVHLVRLGHHDDPARLAVKPMYDAWAPHPADTRQGISAMIDEGVDHGPGPIAGSGMDHKTGPLVDHDQAA